MGCGSGANLYLLQRDGYAVGGIDYSESLIKVAKEILRGEDLRELVCDEAIHADTDIIYDATFSNSVFSYFESDEYARDVLTRMCRKSRYSMGLIDVHDVEKKEEFVAYRKEIIKDYEERYRDLPKRFYSRQFFRVWASDNNCDVKFYDCDIDGYWNSEFVFDVYFYKR